MKIHNLRRDFPVKTCKLTYCNILIEFIYYKYFIMKKYLFILHYDTEKKTPEFGFIIIYSIISLLVWIF